MKLIKIAQGVSLPADIVTQTIAVLAKRRSGKSYFMRRLVEQLFEIGQQVVLVDPKGDQWGIRSSADGKKPGYPIVILGGEHGDVPLEVNAGEIVAKLVVEQRVSILLDLSIFRKHEVSTFMTAFLENLYRLKAKEEYRTPVMLVIDEADAIAPQKPQRGEERMLGAAEDIVRRGGQRGIGCALITQRSAVLNKNVLTQAQMLVVLRTIAPQDISAMKAWIDVHGDLEEGKTLIDSLPSLPIGDAWFWSPGWPTAEGIFVRSHVLPITTFDSGATPAPGEKKITPKNLADIDLDILKTQMAATIEKAKSDNPVLLKKRIAELERAAGSVKLPIATAKATQIDPSVIDRAVKDAVLINTKMYEKRITAWQKYADSLIAMTNRLQKGILNLVPPIFVSEMPPKQILSTPPANIKRPEIRTMGQIGPSEIHPTDDLGAKFGKGERIILNAIAQSEKGTTTENIAVTTGYRQTSRREYLRKLTVLGYIRSEGENYFATQEGIAALGADFKQLPTGQDLQEHLLATLPEGEKLILKVILDSHPNFVTREAIELATNYKTTSVREYLRKLAVRKVIDLERGVIKASDELFN